MSDALEDLQIRFAHQELAIEELTANLLRQGRIIDDLRSELDEVKRDLRELRPSPLATDAADEPPPPHY
ncbi:MAG: SlyX family protein [Gammaproteobacteria bacterium]|nr:SlyX family protein [Gammaproteobacteria bacterium]